MNRLLGCAMVLGSLVLITTSSLANAPDPGPEKEPPPPPVDTRLPLVVEISNTAKEAFLVVPVDLENRKGRGLKGGAEGASGESGVEGASLKQTRTMFAGLALSLAIGGFFFISRGSSAGKVVLICLALGVTSGATLLWANAPPPELDRDRPEPPDPADFHKTAEGEVVRVQVQVVTRGDEVKLVIPKKQRREFLKNLRAATAKAETPSELPPPTPKVRSKPKAAAEDRATPPENDEKE